MTTPSASNPAKLPQQAEVLKSALPSSSSSSSSFSSSSSSISTSIPEVNRKPICCIVVGMAGSGKTTFMQRLNAHVHEKQIPTYIINLDPAVSEIPYNANIDIRDTVKYKEVMKQYGLGPNGGIMTSLNLFSTRFDQVVSLVEKRAPSLDYIFLDTPGQIEVFTWSASGSIITESMASSFTTVLCYVIDTPRSSNPTTFMSNMLYACSILYKTKLPLILVFNKTDVVKHDFAIEWMTDFESFEEALFPESNYMASLTRSMSLVLDEFYKNLKTVGVSAVTGEGIDDFFRVIQEAGDDYHEYYRSGLLSRVKDRKQKEEKRKEEQMTKLQKDMVESRGGKLVLDGQKRRKARKANVNPSEPVPVGFQDEDDDEDEEEAENEKNEEDDEDEDEEEAEELRELEAFKRLCAQDREALKRKK